MASRRTADLRADGAAEAELRRFTRAKLDEPWTARPAQKQVLTNVLRGRDATRAQRQAIAELMAGRPLRDLSLVVAEVLPPESLRRPTLTAPLDELAQSSSAARIRRGAR